MSCLQARYFGVEYTKSILTQFLFFERLRPKRRTGHHRGETLGLGMSKEMAGILPR